MNCHVTGCGCVQAANDERLRRINEVVHGIKVIKLSGWEEQYERKILLARNRELRLLNLDSLHWAIMSELALLQEAGPAWEFY